MAFAAFQPSAALGRCIKREGAKVAGGIILLLLFQICWGSSGVLFIRIADEYKPWHGWALAVCFIGTILLTAATDLMDVQLIPNLYNAMSEEFMTATLETFEGRRNSPETGKIIGIFSHLHYNAVQLFVNVREYMIPAVLSSIIGIIVLSHIHPWVGAVFGGSVVVFALTYVAAIYIMQKPVMEQDRCRLDHDQVATDLLLNIHNIYAVNNTQRQLETFRKDLTVCQQKDQNYYNAATGARSLLMIILTLGFVAPLLMLWHLHHHTKRLPLSAFTSGVFILAFIREYMFATVNHLGNMSWYSAYMLQADQTVRELLYQNDKQPARVLQSTPPADSTIRLQNVVVAELISLPDVTIAPGDRLVIRGPIGSGKSTLLNLLFGKLPYTGSVTIGGVEVRDLDIAVLRDYFLLIPQTVTLFQNTVYYNIAYGTDASREQVQALLDKYGITFARLDDNVGRQGENLSGGQRQLVFLLRGLLHRDKARIVLMDEPTSALDEKTRTLALGIITELMENRAAVIVTHDTVLETLGTRVLHLH